jgi:prophage regulatory protein
MHKILRLKKVIETTGLAKSTIYKKINNREFPSQISLGGKAVGWLASDIQKWIETKILISANDNKETGRIVIEKPSSAMELISVSKVVIGANDNKE